MATEHEISIRVTQWNNYTFDWFNFIQTGKKIYEGRMFRGFWKNTLKVGDIIYFVNGNRKIKTVVLDKIRYRGFGDAYDELGTQMVPAINGHKFSSIEVINIYHSIFNDYPGADGIVMIKLELVK